MRALLPLAPPPLARCAAGRASRARAPRMASAGAVAAGAAAAGGASAYRVLAFEDTYSMVQILGDGGVAYAQLEQKWTTKCVLRPDYERSLRWA